MFASQTSLAGVNTLRCHLVASRPSIADFVGVHTLRCQMFASQTSLAGFAGVNGVNCLLRKRQWPALPALMIDVGVANN
jgi:hypothetical protein